MQRVPKVFLIISIIITLLITDITSVKADVSISKSFSANIISQKQNLPLRKEIGQPITLKELGIEYWLSPLEKKLTKKQLIRTSFRLRDIARSFGSDFPIVISISRITGSQNGENRYTIAGFKNSNGNWTSLTAGYVLSLVIKELNSLEISEQQPLVDLLIKDQKENSYKPLVETPLNFYCYEVLKFLRLK